MAEAKVIPALLPLTTTKGDTEPFSYVLRNKSTGNPIDITGAVARMQLRGITDGALKITLTTSDDLSIPTGSDGRIVIDPTNINLLAAGDYLYDMQITPSGGNKRTYTNGVYTVAPEQTQG